MKWLTLGALCATLLAPLALHTPLAQIAQVAPTTVGRVIVKYKSGTATLRSQAQSVAAVPLSARADALGQRIGVALRAGAGVTERTHVVFASGISSAELAQRLSAESEVEYAVPDERRHRLAAPNDPLYGKTRSPNSCKCLKI